MYGLSCISILLHSIHGQAEERGTSSVTVSFTLIFFIRVYLITRAPLIFLDSFREFVNIVNNIGCTYRRSSVGSEVRVVKTFHFFLSGYISKTEWWSKSSNIMLMNATFTSIILYLQTKCYFCKSNTIFLLILYYLFTNKIDILANVMVFFCKYNPIFFRIWFFMFFKCDIVFLTVVF